MKKNNLSAFLPIIGVVIGALMTFYAQFVLSSKQQESEIRKKAIDLKNDQCVALWGEFAATYQYLFYSGGYSADKIDFDGLGNHIKKLNIAIIRVMPFVSDDGFLELLNVRDTLNQWYHKWEEPFKISIAGLEEKTLLDEELVLRYSRKQSEPLSPKVITKSGYDKQPSSEEYSDFIQEMEKPMHKAIDVLRRELKLVDLGIVKN
jgi:hypothetical protein